jgi:predicted nucleic acid-binding protein
MTRAVLDSSVLVSAFLKPHGSVAGLLRGECRRRYRLCLSEYILAETATSLLTKARLRRYASYADEDVRAYVRWLLTQAEMAAGLPTISAVDRDPADDPIIATALAAKAD